MVEPETHLVLEAPGGLVDVRAECRNNKAEHITITNVPSFVDKLAAPLELSGFGTLHVDTASGGDSFVIVDAAALGFEIVPAEARDLAETGVAITAAANEQLGFRHPENSQWNHVSFCQFAGPLSLEDAVLMGVNAVSIRPGKIDRSPAGTGCQSECQLFAMLEVLPLHAIYIFSRRIENAQAFCDEHAASAAPCRLLPTTSREVLKECGVITTVTNSKSPVFTDSEMPNGVHINGMG